MWDPVKAILVAGLIGLAGYLYFVRTVKQFTGNLGPRESSPVRGTPGDKIVLTGFFTPVGRLAGSVSPFTNKIETYLRFAGLPFKVQDGGFAGSPKGRVRLVSARGHCRLIRSRLFRTSTVTAEASFAVAMDEAWA